MMIQPTIASKRQRPMISKKLPLAERIFLITRTKDGNVVEAQKLKKLGATVIELDSITVGPPTSWSRLDSALTRISEFDWILFTSANGVKFFFDRCAEKKMIEIIKGPRQSKRMKFACVGPATKRSLEEKGFKPQFLPKTFLTSSLASELAQAASLSGARILLPRAEEASREIVSILNESGALVEEVPTYRTSAKAGPKLSMKILSRITDITLTSPSTVEALSKLVDSRKIHSPNIKVHCIGPVTARKASEKGLNVTTIARTHTIDGMIKDIVKIK